MCGSTLVTACFWWWCHWCCCSPSHNGTISICTYIKFPGKWAQLLLCVHYRLHPGPTYACHTCEWTLNNNGTRLVHHYLAYTVYSKTSVGENFCSSSLNCECCPMNYGLFDWQYKSTTMLQWNFMAHRHFPLQTWKFSPADVFPYMVCVNVHLYVRICTCTHMSFRPLQLNVFYVSWAKLGPNRPMKY